MNKSQISFLVMRFLLSYWQVEKMQIPETRKSERDGEDVVFVDHI